MQNELISSARSKEARRSLGLSIKQLAEATLVNRSYLSMFENGKMPLGTKHQQALIDFFKSRIDLETLGASDDDISQRPAAVVRGLLGRCFYLSSDLPADQYERAIAQMETNDERIAELLLKPVSSGVLSPWSSETESDQRELFALLAANHLLFKLLQGYKITSRRPESVDPGTLSDLLSDWFALTLDEVEGITPATAQTPMEGEDD